MDRSSAEDACRRDVELAEQELERARLELQRAGMSAVIALREAGFSSQQVALAIHTSSATVRKLTSDGDKSGWHPRSRHFYASLDTFTMTRLGRTWNLTTLRDAFDEAAERLTAAGKKWDQAARDADIDRLGRRVELGVLYVTESWRRLAGRPLHQFGDALAASFAAGPNGRASVQVDETLLDAGGDEPARLLLMPGAGAVGDHGDGAAEGEGGSRWLITVASVDHGLASDQDLRGFLAWLLVTLPSLAADGIDRRLSWARCLPGAWEIRWWRCAQNGVVGLVGVALILLSLPTLALLLAALYVPGLRVLGRSGARLFLAGFGALYAYVRSQALLDDQVNHLTRQLIWLRGRCRGVAVVAHGQAVAVAHELVRRAAPGMVARMITMGSPLRRFRLARGLSRHVPEVLQGFGELGPGGLAAFGVVVIMFRFGSWIAENARHGDWGAVMVDLVVGAGLLALLTSYGSYGRRALRTALLPARRRAEERAPAPPSASNPPWIDLATATDLLADGPYLAVAAPLGETCVSVTYRAAALTDHLGYLKPKSEPLHRLLEELAKVAPAPAPLVRTIAAGPAAARRRRRVRWLAVGRWAAVLSGTLTGLVSPLPLASPLASAGAWCASVVVTSILYTALALALLKFFWLFYWERIETRFERGEATGVEQRSRLRHWGFALYVEVLALVIVAPFIIKFKWWAPVAGAVLTPTRLLHGNDPFVQATVLLIGGMVIMVGLAELASVPLAYRERHPRQGRAQYRPDAVEVAGRLLRQLPPKGIAVRGARYRAAAITWDTCQPRWVLPGGLRRRCPKPINMLLRNDAVLLDLRDACIREVDRHELDAQAADQREPDGKLPDQGTIAHVKGRRVYHADDPGAARLRLARFRDWRAFRHDLLDLLDWVERAEQAASRAGTAAHRLGGRRHEE